VGDFGTRLATRQEDARWTSENETTTRLVKMAKVWIDDSDDFQPRDEAMATDGELIEPMPVPFEPQPMRTRYTDRAVRPSSNFVAQLMAVDGAYPQTRDLSRADAGLATAAYRSTNGDCHRASPSAGRTRRMS